MILKCSFKFVGDLGFVLIAVQESAFLPPPTQFDILYGFTDLAITMVMIVMVVVVMKTGVFTVDEDALPATVRLNVVISVLLLSAFFARLLLSLTSTSLALS